MAVLALDLNDIGLRIARSDRADLLETDDGQTMSPGVAVSTRDGWATGDAAARQACLRPLDIRSSFWDRLDTDPVDPKHPHRGNRAEVACAHLHHVLAGPVDAGDEIVVAVPAWYDTRQLGLLVAMADELHLPLVGFVPRAVAIGWESDARRLIFIDLGRHRTALSVVDVGQRIAVMRTSICSDVGWHDLARVWTRAVRDEFVRTTRFDPLHDARSEQRLYDRLSTIVASVSTNGREEVALEAGATTHRVTLTESALAHAAHDAVARLCSILASMVSADRPASLVISHEAGLVPGLTRAIVSQFGLEVGTLVPGAAAIDLARLWPQHFEHATSPGVAHHPTRWTRSTVAAADER